jgi:hypothetical protein
MKPNSTERSSCCGAEVTVSGSTGTNRIIYTCHKCGLNCDLAHQSKEKCEEQQVNSPAQLCPKNVPATVPTPTIVNEGSLEERFNFLFKGTLIMDLELIKDLLAFIKEECLASYEEGFEDGYATAKRLYKK